MAMATKWATVPGFRSQTLGARLPPAAAVPLICWCVGGSSPLAAAQAAQDFGAPWLTEAEYEFGEGISGGGAASFSLISTVRALEGGECILVVEPAHLRITIWRPDGSLVREVGGPGEGPGEFRGPLFLEVHPGGFGARDSQRYSTFSNDGELIASTPFPPRGLRFDGRRLRPQALLADGSFLAAPIVDATAQTGFGGNEPIESIRVLHLHGAEDQWEMTPIATLDIRNQSMILKPEGLNSPTGIHMGQLYGDHDLTWYDPGAGNVVVLRRNLGGGEVEILEIAASGDTLWHRLLSPPAVRFGADRVAAAFDGAARNLAAATPSGVSVDAMRDALEGALFIPNPMPGATRMHGTASGEIWFRGYQSQDTLAVWYAAKRDGAGLRQVLLPRGFRPMDATDTHVWGVRRGELGVEYVAGRRLVAPRGAEPGGQS